ncbi:hypothetical protein IMZ48_13255 [Candidatus Bathyarchaeota archaeon]|nr:hypothetical protein [Candidatus Bathyarchaeota archaeon]
MDDPLPFPTPALLGPPSGYPPGWTRPRTEPRQAGTGRRNRATPEIWGTLGEV